MNTAIILAGGVGSRMGADRPKQFLQVQGKPVIAYCLHTFERHPEIDAMILVVAEEWRDYTLRWLKREHITKFKGFAQPGATRQHSILNGLKGAQTFTPEDGYVVIHDAARPLVDGAIITNCLEASRQADGALPVVPVKDTIYQSKDGTSIDRLLKRSELYAGQSPESFRFGPYLSIHNQASEEEIRATAGSSEIAHRHGMCIRLVAGSERNFKITTAEDLETFAAILTENQ